MAAVEDVGDVVDPLGPRGGVAGGGAQVDVPEPSGDLVDGDAGLKQVGGPVGAERVRVRQPLRHANGVAVAADEPVRGDGGEGERVLIAVAAEAHEQRLLVEQPDAASQRVDCYPALERLLDGLGDGHLAFAAALATHIQAVVAGVGARAAQVAGPQATQLGRAQPAVAEHPQQGVVALARDRAPVRDTQQVGVVGVGQRLRRPGLVPRHADTRDRLLQTEVPRERPDHRQIHAHGRRRRRTAAAPAADGQVPAVGGDHVGVEIAHHGRSAELASQPVPEGTEDRPVLSPCAGCRRSGGDPVGLAEQVARVEGRGRRQRGGGEDAGRRDRTGARDELGVDELELGLGDRRERQLSPAHGERLFPKPSMPGHVKPALGRRDRLEAGGSHVRITEFSNPRSTARPDAPAARRYTYRANMTRNALYFPYIRTPEDAWFTRVLLYWDSVGTIVPEGLQDDSEFVSPRMAELREVGMLLPISPLSEVWQVPRFLEEFVSFLENDQGIQRLRRRPSAELSFEKVHVGKLGALADYLVDQGLARHADGPGWELWLDVERRTAGLFMAYLAAGLGALPAVLMDPVTDQADAMAALVGLDSTAGLTLKRARELRLGVLEALLPGPAATIEVKALKQFKDDHGDELAAFRDRVDEELMKAATLAEPDAQREQTAISARTLTRERDEIVKLMQAHRWTNIVFGAVAGVVAAAAAVAAPFVVGGGLAASALAAPGLIPAVYASLKTVETKPEFGTRPMAYAALAQKEFGR